LPILALCLLLSLILNPGLANVADTSKPRIPILGSYFIPGISLCSFIPNDNLPSLSNAYSAI